MLKKRIPKIVIAFTCIIALLMQYTGTLLAATMSYKDTTAKLRLSILHEGGEESSGTLNTEQQKIYDENPYLYFVGDTRVYKLTQKDNLFADALYCLDASKAFPAEGSITYTNAGDLSENDRYNSNSLKWLMENFYLRKQEPELKDSFLEKAFKDSDYELDVVKAVLTDDDIDVIEQYAIWHFTNNGDSKYSELGAIRVISGTDILPGTTIDKTNSKSFIDIDRNKYQYREDMARYLYNYLINSAKNGVTQTAIYPTLKNKTSGKTVIENGFYKAGPFEVTSGNVDCTIKLVDQDGKEITDYNIVLTDGTIWAKGINEIFDRPFYIQIPTSTNIKSIKLILSYNKYETQATVWQPEDNKYQPVVLITKEKKTLEDEQPSTIVKKGAYNLELIKQDKETKERLANSKFSIQIGNGEAKEYISNNDGIITIPETAITESGIDKIKITEIEAPEGYEKIEGTIELEVTKVEIDNKLTASQVKTISMQEKANVVFENQKIIVTIENEKIEEPEIPEEPSTYKLQVVKRDKTLNVNLEDADFKIKIGNNEPKIYTTDDNGIIEIPDIEINQPGIDKILIQEINPPYGYIADGGILELEITKQDVGGKYKITKLDSERSSVEVEDAYIDYENQTVVVKICNTKIPYEKPEEEEIKGKYEVEIVKVDRNGEIIKQPANFNVNGKVYTTENGVTKIAEVDINKSNINQVDKYEIKETKSPDGYTKFDGTIEVEILKKLSDDEGSYKATNANIIVKDSAGNELHRGDNVRITTKNGVSTVTITIVNYEKVDLSLRKFIRAVSQNDTFEEGDYLESRQPQVDLEDLDNGESTTAKYNHSKDAVIVKKGNYILYTLRAYNEGNVDAIASKVVDYLPESLEFVESSEINKIWNYDNETRKLTTNENYEAKLLSAHENGKKLEYQDLQVVCKVSEEIEEDTNIVNIAEITEVKYDDGSLAEDRDSNPNNLEYPEDISKYNGGNDPNPEDDYVPGQEDDDDFERIYVKSIKGYYDLEIIKVDNKGNIIKESNAKFEINGEEKQTAAGSINIKDIEINKTNVQNADKYTIKELNAPNDYSKFDGTLEIEVSKKLSSDEEKYEVENVTLKVNGQENKDIEVINEDGKTKIVVKVVNYPKVDLSLRKYITAVSKDMSFEEEEYYKDREPKVDLEKLDNGESTTAKYEHDKVPVIVEKGDYILYTIRVYNEGKINAIASEVTDYLPEGLEFVQDAKENNIWNFDKETRKLTTNEKYEAKLLDAHEEGKELSYQDLQVVCKVSEEIEEDTNILNIAEITEIKHEDGEPAEDRDSTPNNVEPDKYKPNDGEDDDDYETVLIKSIKGEYNIKVVKVDENGKTISDLVTKFKINDEEKETKDGIIEMPKVEINKNNVDKKDEYIIKEEEAPEGYKKNENITITLEVSKKLSEDGKSYVIDETNLVVSQKETKDEDNKKEQNKIASVTVKDGTVEVKVVNEKIKQPDEPKKPDEPKQPDNPAPQPQPQQPAPETPKTQDTPKKEIPRTPATGDILPIVVLSIISLVLVLNIVQIVISKKKKKKLQ